MIDHIFVFILIFIYRVNCDELAEGANCTVNEYPGTCVRLDQCPWAMKDLLDDNKQPQFCSNQDSTDIVCCTDCKTNVNLTLIVQDPTGHLLHKNGRKAWDMCLNYLRDLNYPCKDHIRYGIKKRWDSEKKCRSYFAYGLSPTGGKDAQRGEFPHMDSCNGDSGGPLMYLNSRVAEIVGVVSFGYECGTQNVPAVYTKVFQYMEWITKNIVA